MALNAVDLRIYLYTSPDNTEFLLEDITGTASASNPEGYGLSRGIASSNVTTNTITVNYTQLETDVEYVLTISANVITAATCSVAGATPIDIFAELESTVWPFTHDNPFNLIDTFGDLVTQPEFDDMVYTVDYQVEGTVPEVFDYTTSSDYLNDIDTACCISKKFINLDINNLGSTLTTPEIAAGYLLTARTQAEEGNVDEANDYLQRAETVCENDNCGCGCD